MASVIVQAEVGKEGKGPAGMTCLVYTGPQHEKKVTGIDGGRICAVPRRAENPICQNLATAQNAYHVMCPAYRKERLRCV